MPQWLHAVNSATNVTPSGTSSSLFILWNKITTSDPRPCAARPLIIVFHTETWFLLTLLNISVATSILPHLAYMSTSAELKI
uniref:Uncharacterized protein n=1 Tax=Arundo donax TaxID=35708 RepID=A0A0A9D658_ARUDO